MVNLGNMNLFPQMCHEKNKLTKNYLQCQIYFWKNKQTNKQTKNNCALEKKNYNNNKHASSLLFCLKMFGCNGTTLLFVALHESYQRHQTSWEYMISGVSLMLSMLVH